MKFLSKGPPSQRRRDFWVLLAAILAPGMVFLVSTTLGVALPAIQSELRASGNDLIWIVNSYTLLQAAFIFLSGSLGDHYGRRRLYLLGVAVFAPASLASGLAGSAAVLILARLAQGVGSGMMITCSLAILTAHFEDERHAWAIGIWSAFTMLISGAGPIIGGWLTEIGWWRMIFFINLPLSLLVLYALAFYVPESYDMDAPSELDISGTVISTAALMLCAVFCIEGPRRGFDDPLVLFSGLFAIVLALAFVWIEGHSDHPMLPLNFFRSRTFTGANSVTLLLYGAMNSVLFFLPLSLIQVQGYSASAVGLALLPMTVLMGLISIFMSRIVDIYGLRPPLIIGPLIMGGACALLAQLEVNAGQESYWSTLMPAVCILGIGMGVTLAPLTTAVMGSVDQSHVGIASGLNNAVSRSAQVLAIAILGGMVLVLFKESLMSAPAVLALPEAAQAQLAAGAERLAETPLPSGLSALQKMEFSELVRASFAGAIRAVTWIAAGLCLLSAVLAAFMIEPSLPASSEEVFS